MELNAAGIVAGLAAAVFAAQSARVGVRPGPLWAYGLAAVSLSVLASLSVDSLAMAIAFAAGTALARPRWWLLPPLGAGFSAAAWMTVLHAQGLPWLAAASVPLGVVVAAVALAGARPGFLSSSVRDEALVLVTAFALLLALGPGVVAGWRSAVALTAEPLAPHEVAVSPWLAAPALGSVLLGVVYAIWKRR